MKAVLTPDRLISLGLGVVSLAMMLSHEFTASAGFSIAAVTVPTWRRK